MADGKGPVTSRTLLRALWGQVRNERAWQTFVERYQPLIYGWCRREGVQHADADEVTARVLHKLTRALQTFEYDPTRSFRAWLKTVVTHAVCDLRETTRRPGCLGSGDTAVRNELEQVAAPGDLDSLVQELDEPLRRDLERAEQVIGRVRDRVEPRTWQAWWLTAIESKPAADVAAQLGTTVAAVFMAKSRVGKMLRQEGEKLQSQDTD